MWRHKQRTRHMELSTKFRFNKAFDEDPRVFQIAQVVIGIVQPNFQFSFFKIDRGFFRKKFFVEVSVTL